MLSSVKTHRIAIALLFTVAVLSCTEAYIRCHYGPFILPPGAQFYFDHAHHMRRFQPNMRGYAVSRVSTAYERTNSDGWKSNREYDPHRTPGTTRICCIGACTTAGVRVATARAYPARLESLLTTRGLKSEVYAFGLGRIDLAQELHMARYAVRTFHPDILILESLRISVRRNPPDRATTVPDIHLRIAVDSRGNIIELLPDPPEYWTRRGWGVHETGPFPWFLQHLGYRLDEVWATWWYVRMKTDVYNRIRWKLETLRNLTNRILPTHAHPATRDAGEESLDWSEWGACTAEEGVRLYTCIAAQLSDLGREGTCLVGILYIPKHVSSYNSRQDEQGGEQQLRTLQQRTIDSRYRLMECDLTELFLQDHARTAHRYDFLYDGHLNEYGHALVAEGLAQVITGKWRVEVQDGSGYSSAGASRPAALPRASGQQVRPPLP